MGEIKTSGQFQVYDVLISKDYSNLVLLSQNTKIKIKLSFHTLVDY